MKKIFMSMMGCAALVCSTSCSDDNVASVAGGDTLAKFNVVLSEGAGSRAISDGKTVDKLYYEVYTNVNGVQTLTGIDDCVAMSLNENGVMSATIEFNLAKGQNFDVVFWACKEGAYDTKDLRAIPVNLGATNDETKDAFTAVSTITDVAGAFERGVTLYRPFAQINFGTPAADIAAARKSGSTIVSSQITVGYAAESYDALAEEGVGAKVYEFQLATMPDEATEELVVGVEGSKAYYEYLATTYVLLPGKANQKVASDIIMTVPTGLNQPVTLLVANAPQQRNYRTNVLGNLLTDQGKFNVVVDNRFETPDNIVFEAFEIGGTMNLPCDMEVGHTLYVKSGVEAVLNLNGHSLKNNAYNKATDVIVVEEGAKLTINGEGTVEAVSGNDGFTVISEGELVINGGTYKAGAEANGEANAVIYARGKGKVYVNGGTFPNENNSAYVLNKKDADRATTVIEVRGGTFHKFNPADNAAENEGTNFVAAGYRSIQIAENVWQVKEVPSNMYVYNEAEFREALSICAQTIILGDNITLYSTEGLVATSDFTLDMNGFDLGANLSYEGGSRFTYGVISITSGAKAKIVGEGDIINTNPNDRGAYAIAVYDGAELTIEGNITAGASHDALYVGKGKLVVKNGFYYSTQDIWPADGATATCPEGCHRATVVNLSDDNLAAGLAVFEAKGGVYVNMDPSSMHEMKLHNRNFVAAGYKVEAEAQTNGDVWYKVVEE